MTKTGSWSSRDLICHAELLGGEISIGVGACPTGEGRVLKESGGVCEIFLLGLLGLQPKCGIRSDGTG